MSITANRRTVLARLLALTGAATTVIASGALQAQPSDDVDEAAKAAVAAMAKRHGGKWKATVCHEDGGFILIKPARRR